jgi:hypothetical protein
MIILMLPGPRPTRSHLAVASFVVLVAFAGFQAVALIPDDWIPTHTLGTGDQLEPLSALHGAIPLTLRLEQLPTCSFVIFSSPDCSHCQRRAPGWDAEFGEPGTAILLSVSAWDETAAFATEYGPKTIPTFAAAEQADVIGLGVLGVPTIVATGPNGAVAAVASGGNYSADSLRLAAGCVRADQ